MSIRLICHRFHSLAVKIIQKQKSMWKLSSCPICNILLSIEATTRIRWAHTLLGLNLWTCYILGNLLFYPHYSVFEIHYTIPLTKLLSIDFINIDRVNANIGTIIIYYRLENEKERNRSHKRQYFESTAFFVSKIGIVVDK